MKLIGLNHWIFLVLFMQHINPNQLKVLVKLIVPNIGFLDPMMDIKDLAISYKIDRNRD